MFTQPDQAARDTGNRLLSRFAHRTEMRVDAAGKVEHHLNRSVDLCSKFDMRHSLNSRFGVIVPDPASGRKCDTSQRARPTV